MSFPLFDDEVFNNPHLLNIVNSPDRLNPPCNSRQGAMLKQDCEIQAVPDNVLINLGILDISNPAEANILPPMETTSIDQQQPGSRGERCSNWS